MKRALYSFAILATLLVRAEDHNGKNREGWSPKVDAIKALLRTNQGFSLYLEGRIAIMKKAIVDGKEVEVVDKVITEKNIENIAKRTTAGKPMQFQGGGAHFLSRFEYYPNKCIPLMTVVSHGHGSSQKNGGEGIPIYRGNVGADSPGTGIYFDHTFIEKAVREAAAEFKKYYNKPTDYTEEEIAQIYRATALESAATLSESSSVPSLEKMIKKGEINFCSDCRIQLFACNIGGAFAHKMAALSGCEVVYGTGNVTSADHTDNPWGLNPDSGELNHIWVGDKKAGNARDGSMQIVIPKKNPDGTVTTRDYRLTTPGRTGYNSVTMEVVPLTKEALDQHKWSKIRPRSQ